MKIVFLGGELAGHIGIVRSSGRADDVVSVLPKSVKLADLADADFPEAIAQVSLQEVKLEAPLVPDARIFCIGLNFKSHAEEAGMAIPAKPSIFPRFPSSLVGPDEDIILPSVSTQFDFEVEPAAVIGRAGRHIPEDQAGRHVLGFTCMAENSVRDWQAHSRQVTPGKNFDRSGAIGPWIVTADEMPPVADMVLETFVNGVRRQHGKGSDLIFSLEYCVSYTSTFMELRPGDVISLGTPPGVAMWQEKPDWLKAGDEVELRISGIGSLRNTVGAEQRPGI